MLNKIKRAFMYLKIRVHEFVLCIKEFSHSKKRGGSAYKSFTDSLLLVEVHSVEKGLGLRNTAPGHSAGAVQHILGKLLAMSGDKNRTEEFAYRETFRVIMAYVDYQEGFDTSNFKAFASIKEKYDWLCDKLGDAYVRNVREELHGGARIIPKEELTSGKNFDFDSFISTRHSTRIYEKESIDEEIIKRAVEMANKGPSACNRQPSKVYFCNEESIVSRVDSLITGSSGFKGETPNYLVVTTNRAYFQNEEQFQWYINGGIYLAYLSLALHSEGIGHCIMQWKAFYKTEEELKNVLGISREEAIIAVVGCGYYSGDTKCIYAQRRSADESLKVVR